MSDAACLTGVRGGLVENNYIVAARRRHLDGSGIAIVDFDAEDLLIEAQRKLRVFHCEADVRQSERAHHLSDLHAFPESDAAFDVIGGFLGVGIIPGGVRIAFAVDFDVVVLRGAFPSADAAYDRWA